MAKRKLKTAQMRFLRTLFGLTRLEWKRNNDDLVRLKASDLTEGTALYRENYFRPLAFNLGYQYLPEGSEVILRGTGKYLTSVISFFGSLSHCSMKMTHLRL
jgi:hypothetical protein